MNEAYPDLGKWEYSTVLKAPSSMELWAAGKFIGRECATINKSFMKCKMEKGEHPGLCVDQGDLVRVCTKNVIAEVQRSCPTPFANFQKCLDSNDYRIGECLQVENELISCWNGRENK